MSLAILKSRALVGMDAPEVVVEAHLANGLPAFNLVGLPDTEVKEARDRVRSAIQNAHFDFPNQRFTVNLAPADLPKEGGRFDLPIALGILGATGQIECGRFDALEFAGELSLSGELRPVRGALALALGAKKAGRAIVLPSGNAPEASLVPDVDILPADSLLAVCAHLNGCAELRPYRGAPLALEPDYADLADVKGQVAARRALEVAAAGGHSLLMSGPPGTGKSMLASRFPGILPPMTEEEALSSAMLLSIAGLFRPENWRRRMYRCPHHSASGPALVGGGSDPRPGEISLAHEGVLFLDELPEFDRRVLEALREPLETGVVCVSRALRQVEYPARFQLLAAMNPCPCGYLGHASGRCRCTPDQVARYRGKLSGPFLDRMDIFIDVPALSPEEMQGRTDGEASAAVRARVVAARERQQQRQGKANAHLGAKETERHCLPDSAGRDLLQKAIARLNLSARAYHRILRVARTIADLEGSLHVGSAHLAEAVMYRRNEIPS